MKKIKYILLLLFLFICTLLYTSIKWAIKSFDFLNFDEIIFQLTTPLQATESSIINSYLLGGLLPALLILPIIIIVIVFIYHYLSVKTLEINIKLWKKKINITLKTIYLKILITLVLIFGAVAVAIHGLEEVNLFTYIERTFLNDSIDFFAENYIDPKSVEITFPEKKRNLIYIYAESLETSYFDTEHGGINTDNPMEPLEDLTNENTMFSNTDNRGGFYSYLGTNYTSGSLVSQTAGVSLKIVTNSMNQTTNKYKELLPGAYSLNDILTKEGYNQTFILGSDKAFGSRDAYFESHGNMVMFDTNAAIEAGKIPKNYNVWWGYEDSKVFEYAKEEATRLSNAGKPFNLTLLTTSTHHPDGYTEDTCSNPFQRHYSNAIYCSTEQINEFVRWAQKQSFYNNTTIIIVGDHFSYKPDYLPSDDRSVYNLIINSAVEEQNSKNREFSAMDMYPTTLAALGVTIEGDQLGIGVNLYSGKETMPEKYGKDEFNEIIDYSSKYYMNNILTKKEG